MTASVHEMYRGFECRADVIGEYLPPGGQCFWRPNMRELPDGPWVEICIIGKDCDHALEIARTCVDYDYRVKVWEFLNERVYDVAKDGFIPASEA